MVDAAEVHWVAVCEVPAIRQIHGQNFIAWAQNRQVNRGICLAARVWLHVGVVSSEQYFGAFNRELFNDVDLFAAAVVAFAGVALGVFVS